MSFVRKPVAEIPSGVEFANSPAELSVIREPGCAATLWSRSVAKSNIDWLAHLDPDCLPKGRVVLRPSAVYDTVVHLCDMAKTPAGAEQAWLQNDISDLAIHFADLMKTQFLRLRLDVVTTNACRRFHVDAITARLVCTYRGFGTQYGISAAGSDPTTVFTAETGSPIILRGTQWPEAPAAGLVHRSPPIEGSGETRLVLVLDPIFDLEDEL